MIDHVVVRSKDLGRARRFYAEALAPLGYNVIHEFEDVVGLGIGSSPDLWVGRSDQVTGGMHLAFNAARRAQVDAFHAAALRSGGRDNGAPGIRAIYHPNYYEAFVFDPEGNNIEAVCHDPQG